MSERKRILVLTLSFGAGHVRAAESVVAELHKRIPDADLRLVDALENCSLGFRAFYVWTYWAMIRYAPSVWNRFFHARLERRDEQTAPVWMWRKGCRKVFDEIQTFQPEAIIACEVGASEIAVIARRENLTNAPIVNVITDFEAEPVWVKPEIAAFAVPNQQVAEQLQSWGANAEKIKVCGIPLDESFDAAHDVEKATNLFDSSENSVVLLMGGGMGPTRMDEVAARLLEDGKNLNIVALVGKDERARRGLEKLRNSAAVNLKIVGWTNEVAALMRAAAVLVTKPGGLTLSEAAACGVPMVFFDAIPGPEESNAARFSAAGAGVSTRGSNETAAEVLRLLSDENKRRKMAENACKLAQPDAAKKIVSLIMEICRGDGLSLPARLNEKDWRPQGITLTKKSAHPVLFLTINNGAGHTRAAEAVAEEWRKLDDVISTQIVEVSDFMSPLARFTHITAYLWLVKNFPSVWDKIDAYQKRQTNTSPEWFYRRECRKLFDLAREIQLEAIIATEVGCCEIAALIKRDLNLEIPLVAVNVNYDADRAWVQPEVDFYCVPLEAARAELVAHGANIEKVKVLGAPMASEFGAHYDKRAERGRVCRQFNFEIDKPIILIAGGSEGLGKIEQIVKKLLNQKEFSAQLIVLTGRSAKLKTRLEKLARTNENAAKLKVLGWTNDVPNLMRAADLMISKLGNTFDEALAVCLPIIALEPPPGSERVQYRLLNEWKTGYAVKTLDELEKTVARLLKNPEEIEKMRRTAKLKRQPNAAEQIADWLEKRILMTNAENTASQKFEPASEKLNYCEVTR